MSAINKRIEKLKAEAAGYSSALSEYPDLKIHKNRWNQERLVSSAVNPKATHCQILHNCGCCSDSLTEVWPYLTTADGTRIFADGIPFTVGERCWGGERAYDGWQEKFRERGLSEKVIAIVEAFLAENQPSDDEEDDE